MRYQPLQPPSTSDPTLTTFLIDELANIAAALEGVESILLTVLHVEPAKPRDGMIVLADGTDFNPGAGGAGFYGRSAGAWVKLG